MKEDKKLNESLKFVVNNYDDESFSKSRAWKKLMPPVAFWNVRRIAAASIIAVVVTASAFIYHAAKYGDTPHTVPEKQETPVAPVRGKEFATRIEFKDAPLKDVVNKIEEVYQVKIKNIPESDVRLTLSYEGTAEELIDVINEIAGTHLKVER